MTVKRLARVRALKLGDGSREQPDRAYTRRARIDDAGAQSPLTLARAIVRDYRGLLADTQSDSERSLALDRLTCWIAVAINDARALGSTGTLALLVALGACRSPMEAPPLRCVVVASAPGAVVWASPIPGVACVVPPS